MPLARSRSTLALYLAATLIIAMAAYGPIPQLANYHDFADQRTLLGIPHGADVLSNAGFMLAAGYAAVRAWSSRSAAQLVFAGALALTAVGSSWYHLAPDDARLVWDRLPIALACAALLAASLREVYPKERLALPLLLVFGALGVAWWSVTGDLRPYLLIQAAPLLLIPVLQWQAGAPVAQRRAFGLAIGLYVLAKVCELADQTIFDALVVVSGHTLKHIFATMAAFVLARQFGGMR